MPGTDSAHETVRKAGLRCDEISGRPATVEFTLDGRPYTALNGGSQFTFSEAVSFRIMCADQAEVDHYWDRLTEGAHRVRRASEALMTMKKIDIDAIRRAADGVPV